MELLSAMSSLTPEEFEDKTQAQGINNFTRQQSISANDFEMIYADIIQKKTMI